ncbi:ABC transporter substrate-binding protein [Methylomonas sp. MED-D]|uniref:ABC transporter substrate-binding protein n=1 Tax=Methylomonas koyamae TaxID=702114 RepID=A0A177N6Z3_9GAMM|nr:MULTISPECIES: ABC transporter substrate-binding protein [Methylomonas]MDT4332636.1 ABC transporter substrate-binding protein [Methylomonas sp. MV1]OAI12999.1 ABC transporter substrate-binding protein [Methylomonas koyamae]OHX34564.1 ABC transporter substrate-binding protein [Methylomonas sp. LWB]
MQTSSVTRDWILYSLLGLVIVLILLAMYQIDRQWLKLSDMQTALADQAQAVRELRGLAGSGALSAQTANPPSSQVAQAFQRAYAATKLADYARGDWSVEAFGTNLKTITPLISTDAYAANVQSYVQESLITRNPDTLAWEGLVAKNWTVSEDGLTISFDLRDDVSFSDGQPLTAEDVAFTFTFIMTDAIQAPRDRAYLEKIQSVKADGKDRVTFVFKEPYFEALSLAGGMNIMPKHFYEPYLKEPQKFNESKGLLLGSGPYRLADPKNWTPDQGSVELLRNERYWGDVQPAYNRILWKIIQNDSARLTTYRNGDIDSYSARPVEYRQLQNDAQIQGKSQSFEYMPPVVGYSYIGWNQIRGGKPTRFADKRVRQAMTYLTDTGRIIKDVFLGYAEPAVSPFGNASKQHAAALQPYQANLDKAKALLKEAGYEDRNKDGVLEDQAGQAFEFKLTYFQANEDTSRMVLLLKDLYAKAGVKLVPFPQEWPVMLENLDKKDFDAITLGWTSSIETDLYQAFHSSQAISKGDNFIGYQNPELDKLIDEARRTVDEAKRMPLWQQAERILYEDQPYTFLMRRKSLLFVDKRIHNLQMTKLGLNLGSLPLENYVPLAQQKYTQ